MRLTSRFVGLAVVILAAFWFAAANSGEMVLVDLVLLRLRIALPLLVFGSVLTGMAISFIVGWRSERKKGLAAVEEADRLAEPVPFYDAAVRDLESSETEQSPWH